MPKLRFSSLSVAAATAFLAFTAAGCGVWEDLAEEILSSQKGSEGSGGTCSYEGKTYPAGATISVDSCTTCTCTDKGALSCSKNDKCDPGAPPAQTCEKLPLESPDGACVGYADWKVLATHACDERKETLTDLVLGVGCDNTSSAREMTAVCCSTTPSPPSTSGPQCDKTVDPATGAACTVCVDASGAVVKSDCPSASTPVCKTSVDATGRSCTACYDAYGKLVKTDCP